MRRLFALATVCVLLAACTDGDASEPEPSSTPSASVSASPTPSASALAPPVMPEVAKEHTRAGVKAWIHHFWSVVNYAQDTLDVEPLRPLVAETCKPCQDGIAAIERTKENGGHSVGGANRVRRLRVERYKAGDLRYDVVTFTVGVEEMKTDYPDDSMDTVQPAATIRGKLTLVAQEDGGWILSEWEAPE